MIPNQHDTEADHRAARAAYYRTGIMLRHIGTRYTVAQAWRIMRRAKRFGILRENFEVERWLSKIQK